jgi:hypothetical protein
MIKITMSSGKEYFIEDIKAKNLSEYTLPNKLFPIKIFVKNQSDSYTQKEIKINYSLIESVE